MPTPKAGKGLPLGIDVHAATPEQIRRAGIEVLARELGVVGMIRFLQQFDPGAGDYTRDRHRGLGNPGVDELFDRMERKRQASKLAPLP